MPRKFGRQPCHRFLTEANLPIGKTADQIGIPRQHFVRALNGAVRPHPILREELPKLLGRPLEDLFTPDALAREYGMSGRWPLGSTNNVVGAQ